MLITRTLAALVFAPTLLALVWLGGAWISITCLVLSMLLAHEYYRMVFGNEDALLQRVGMALALFVAAGEVGFVPATIDTPVIAVMLSFFMVLANPNDLATTTKRAALLGFGAVYAGGLLPYLSKLRAIPDHGLHAALMALLCTWAADTGAYFAGHLAGKRKLYPKISPGKTLEGAIGGVGSGIAVAYACNYVFDMGWFDLHLVVVGALSAVLGIVGDLCESMLKRSAGVKDSGKLIPGHGGVLDRFDAVMFVAPMVYFYVQTFRVW